MICANGLVVFSNSSCYLSLVLKADRLGIIQLILFDNNLFMAWAAKVYRGISKVFRGLHRLIIDIIETAFISIINASHLITKWSGPIGKFVFEYWTRSCFWLYGKTNRELLDRILVQLNVPCRPILDIVTEVNIVENKLCVRCIESLNVLGSAFHMASSQLIFENITCLCIIKFLIDHWMIRVPIRVNLIQSFIFIFIFTKWWNISILNIIRRNRACLHLADLGCVIFLCSFPSSRHVWNKAPFTDWWRSFVVYIVGCVGS